MIPLYIASFRTIFRPSETVTLIKPIDKVAEGEKWKQRMETKK
jgi:hypothetical protein